MTISSGTFVLLICSTMTGLIVEGIKTMVTIKKPNIVAAIVSVVVGVLVSVGYIWANEIVFNVEAVMYVISIVVLSWLCSMLGFDKVMQTIAQIKR